MKPTLTPEERLVRLQEVAKAAGGQLLSKRYIDSKTFYEWKCKKGHIWKATLSGQGKTRWCPKCGFATRARKKTQTTEEVNLRLSVRGVKLAGEYDPKMKIQKCICLVCDKPTTTSFTRIPKGYGCKTCLRKIQPTYRRKKIDDILSELERYQVTLIDTYIGISKPMLFRCDVCKIEFTTKIDYLRRYKKHGCKESKEVVMLRLEKYFSDQDFTLISHPVSSEKPCSIVCNKCGKKIKILLSVFKKMKLKCRNCSDLAKLESIKSMAESKSGHLLSKKYIGMNKKYEFKCAQGHIWSALPIGTWCRKCKGHGKGIEDIRAMAEKRGGQLLSEVFIGVDKKYDFKCSVGHSFSMTFAKMQSNQWCSICSKGSKSEELVRVVMEQIFGFEFKRVRPSWLKNDRNVPMELDGYSQDLKIAFEYQGRQHYEILHFLVDQDLKRIQKNDRLKAKICKERGVSLFIFTHEQNYRQFPKIALEQAKKFGLPIERYDFDQEIDFDRAYIRTDKLEELRERTASKSLKLLSKKWLGVEHYYKVECQVCKNSYEVAGTAFMGRKINGCRFCSLVTNSNKSTLSIEIPIKFAKKHKGKLLDTEYKNMHAPMQWRCHKGHEFTARFNNMVRRDEFCAICEGRPTKNQFNQDTATNRFSEFGLVLVGEFKGVGIAVPTICRKCKNINSSRLNAIIKGSPPCLYCSGKRIDEKTAFKILKTHKLEPKGKYVNTYFPILCKCLICGLEKNYKVLDVKATSRGCSHKPKR
jgi:hypothetical protein